MVITPKNGHKKACSSRARQNMMKNPFTVLSIIIFLLLPLCFFSLAPIHTNFHLLYHPLLAPHNNNMSSCRKGQEKGAENATDSRKRARLDDKNDATTTPVWPLVLRWLSPADAFVAQRTCQEWKTVMPWKEICENKWGKDLLQAIVEQQAVVNQNETTMTTVSRVTFRRLAQGLLSTIPLQPEFTFPDPQLAVTDFTFPDPQLAVTDLFCTLQVYRPQHNEEGDIVDTPGQLVTTLYCTDLSPWLAKESVRINVDSKTSSALSFSTPDFVDRNLGSRWGTPLQRIFARPYSKQCNYHVSMHLFRRDTGQSICIFDEVDTPLVFSRHHEEQVPSSQQDRHDMLANLRASKDQFRLAHENNGKGDIARRLMEARGMHYGKMDGNIVFRPLNLQPPGSPTEPNWLRSGRGDIVSEQDYQDILLRCPLHFEMVAVEIEPRFRMESDDSLECAQSVNDLLLILDGLDWQ